MNKIFDCIAVDDNPDALKMITRCIKEIETLRLIHSDTNPINIIELLENNTLKPDIIFVDFEMPEMHGKDFALRVKGGPMVVFTTAYRDFGPESFEAEAIAYLLKPITKSKLELALFKARQIWETKQILIEKNKPTHVTIPGTGKENKKLFAIDEIMYAKACRNFTDVYLKGKKHTTFMNLSMLENLLPKTVCLRISRSYLVNVSQIDTVTATTITLKDHTKINIGPTYREEIAQFFKSRSSLRLD